MTPIEILAIIFAILILVKLIVIAIKKEAWMRVTKVFSFNPVLLSLILLVLAGIVGYYIFNALSIIQVGAVMLFTALLMALSFAAYPKIILKMRNEVVKEDFRKAWLSIVIWLAIAIWTLIVIFA